MHFTKLRANDLGRFGLGTNSDRADKHGNASTARNLIIHSLDRIIASTLHQLYRARDKYQAMENADRLVGKLLPEGVK